MANEPQTDPGPLGAGVAYDCDGDGDGDGDGDADSGSERASVPERDREVEELALCMASWYQLRPERAVGGHRPVEAVD